MRRWFDENGQAVGPITEDDDWIAAQPRSSVKYADKEGTAMIEGELVEYRLMP